MKKILSFTMVILMMLSVCAFPAFAAENDELAQKFYDYCVENLPEDMQPSEGDTVKIYSPIEIDGVTYFFGNPGWISPEDTDVICKLGEWNIYTGDTYHPYDLGIYAASGDEIYTLEEAYNKGFVADVSLLASHSFINHRIYKDYVPNPENKYEDKIIPTVFAHGAWADPMLRLSYSEGYEYFSDNNTSTGDEATPDYVLIYLASGMCTDMPEICIYGDYLLYQSYGEHPFTFGRGIYIPETGEVYDLEDACEMGIEGIEKVFTEAKVGRLLGDMDKDRKLTVKDATYIQKCLAGIIEFDKDDWRDGFEFVENPPLGGISDFNRDGERNIKDATAIQKKIAGLPY